MDRRHMRQNAPYAVRELCDLQNEHEQQDLSKGGEIMVYTIIWLIVWLCSGATTFTFGTGGVFWALVVAILADIFWTGYWNRGWVRKA